MKKKATKVKYVCNKNITEEEQRMVDKAFDVLFDSVYERYWKKGHKK